MVLLNETEYNFLFCINFLFMSQLVAERLWVGFDDQRYGVSTSSLNSMDVNFFFMI